MEQHYKRYKGSQKHFNLWMLSETEEFYPTQIPNDPLKKISEYIKSRPVSLPEAEKQVQKETKKKPAVYYKADFNLISYWEKFLKGFNLGLVRYLEVKEVLTLASTCKYFKQALEDEAIWSYFLRNSFGLKMFDNPRQEEKELRSVKLYFKYLYIKEKIGIPYHSGYFQAYGAPEVTELVSGMVDFMVPKRENIKGFVQEIMMRNKSKMMEIRLSWLKEKGEICLWSADFSVKFEEKIDEARKLKTMERADKFYPCFVKKYLVEDGKIEETCFLEDRFLVIKFLNNLEQTVFRVIDMSEELYSIGKNWSEPAPSFDYIVSKGISGAEYEKEEGERSVSFVIRQDSGEMKMKFLKDNRVVFYIQNQKEFVGIYWDLKEKKELGFVKIDLVAPVSDILNSKREVDGLLKSFILDEHMNVYCVEILVETKEVKIKEILLPKEQKDDKSGEDNDDEEEEEEEQETQEIGEKIAIKYANESKSNRKKKYQHLCFSTSKKIDELGPARFEDKIRKYYHDSFTTQDGQEEWLIIHHQENFHFINLDKKQLRKFSLEEGTGKLHQRNWNIYKNKLIILSPTHIFCHQICFENQKVSPAFYRDIVLKDRPQSVMPWIFQDGCFTIIVLAHPFFHTNTSKLSLIVTSTQEFFHNKSNMFNKVYHLFTTNDVLDRPDRWEIEKENFTEKIQMKFQDEKFFVLGERSSFYFDLSAVFKQERTLQNGWSFNIIDINSINNIQKAPVLPVQIEEPPKETAKIDDEDKEKKPKGSKFVNYMKLEENRNSTGAKEKGNGWSKTGKSDLAREQDKEKKEVKGKGDKYYKNIRQGKRSEKMN